MERLPTDTDDTLPDIGDYCVVSVYVPRSYANADALSRHLFNLSRWTSWSLSANQEAARQATLWGHANRLTFAEFPDVLNCQDEQETGDGGNHSPSPTTTGHAKTMCYQCTPPCPTYPAFPYESIEPNNSAVITPPLNEQETTDELCRLLEWAVHTYVRFATYFFTYINTSDSRALWSLMTDGGETWELVSPSRRLFLILSGLISNLGIVSDVQAGYALAALEAIDNNRSELVNELVCTVSVDSMVDSIEGFILRKAVGLRPEVAIALAFLFKFIDLEWVVDTSSRIGIVPDTFVSSPCLCDDDDPSIPDVTPPEGYALIPMSLDSLVRGIGGEDAGLFTSNGLNADDTVFALAEPLDGTGTPYPVADRRGYYVEIVEATLSTTAITARIGNAGNTNYIMGFDHDPIVTGDIVAGSISSDTVVGSWANTVSSVPYDNVAETHLGGSTPYNRIQTTSVFVGGNDTETWVISFRGWWVVLDA